MLQYTHGSRWLHAFFAPETELHLSGVDGVLGAEITVSPDEPE